MRNDSNYPFSYTDLTDTFCIGNVDIIYNIFYFKQQDSDIVNVVDTFCEKLANDIIYGNLFFCLMQYLENLW